MLLPAVHIAELLASPGVQLEMIVDEGIGLALAGVAPFTKQPVALVGTAEKQLQTVQVGAMHAAAQLRVLLLCRQVHCAMTFAAV